MYYWNLKLMIAGNLAVVYMNTAKAFIRCKRTNEDFYEQLR